MYIGLDVKYQFSRQTLVKFSFSKQVFRK